MTTTTIRRPRRIMGRALLSAAIAVGAVGGTLALDTREAHAATFQQCFASWLWGRYVHEQYLGTTGLEQRYWMRNALENNSWYAANCM